MPTDDTDAAANAAIDALYAAWTDAFARRDVDAVLELLTTDYSLWAPSAPPLTFEALRPLLTSAFEAYDVVPNFEREERMVVGDLAFERGWDVQRMRARQDTTHDVRENVGRQRVFLILRRGPDRRWRFARGMSQPGPEA